MASVIFTDCSSSTAAATRFLPLRRLSVLHSHWSMPFKFSPSNHSLLRTIVANGHSPPSPSVLTAVMASATSATIIDGKSIAKQIRDEITAEISRMKDAIGVVPGLAVILVGDRKDSATYVRNKKKACESVGINSYEAHLPEDSTEQEVLKYISGFNDDPSVHGILVQLPLPSHMNEQKILNAVSIEKDVDGFHPLNIGRLICVVENPCLYQGRCYCQYCPLKNQESRGDHKTSRYHHFYVGMPNMVRGSWIKPGAVIIDVGINPVEDAKSARGYRLVGDVCYEEACKIASAITPVPGGVGPMTIAMLLSNSLSAAKRVHNFK
ncbi:hypothetical protein LOK49_LG03G02296 [Camellia lanceoleosa]|uniref:Uncharacterized protein n=1 Tax=Camellia lanceoleosa TaxID=1840588 RepID=A0ACC0IA82_9ERIC|nr:hypothetical protein LOK49_LG03G02296 [Camellia lanceoleosa]